MNETMTHPSYSHSYTVTTSHRRTRNADTDLPKIKGKISVFVNVFFFCCLTSLNYCYYY